MREPSFWGLMFLHHCHFAVTVHYDVEKGQEKPIPLADFLIKFSGGAGGNLSRC